MDPEPDTWPAPTPRDELLTRIESRGGRLRRRRRTGIAAGVVALVAFVALPFATADDDGSDDDTSVVASEGDAAPTSTAGAASTATTDTATDAAGDPGGSGSSSTTSTSAAPSTTPTTAPEGPSPSGPAPPPTTAADPPPVCRNSFDLRCGPLVLDPPPQNQPATAELEVVTPSPRVGEPVTVRVRVRDPDFRIECLVATAGDRAFRVYGEVVRPEAGGCGFPAIGCAVSTDGAPSGPWDPPPPTGSTDVTFDLTHTFSNPGEQTFSVSVDSFGLWRSGDLCFEGGGPYASRFRESITVTVT